MNKAENWVRALLVGILSVLALIGCGKKGASDLTGTELETEQTLFVPGTYDGIAGGYGGDIKVLVTVSEDTIEQIEIVEHFEAEGVGARALEQISNEIIEYQSLGIDALSGSTQSSNGLITAVEDALRKVCSDMERIYQRVERPPVKWQIEEYQTDVLVIGGGAAGITAALTARAAGADVILVERQSELGGNLSNAEGLINGGQSEFHRKSGGEDSRVLLIGDLMTAGHQLNDPVLVGIYAENTGEAFDWLVNQAAVSFEVPAGTFGRHQTDRVFKAVKGGEGIREALLEMVRQSDIQVMTGVRMSRLLIQNDTVIGASGVVSEDTIYEIKAKRVVLATGGYGNNSGLLPQAFQDLVYEGLETARGDGLTAAMREGAGTQMMEYDGEQQQDAFQITLGGLCINEQMQVLNERNQPIGGLLAAGEVVGGLHGDSAMTGIPLSWAFTSGRLAGRFAVEVD